MSRWMRVALVLGDLICLHLGYLVAFLLRFRGSLPPENWSAYLELAPWLTLAALLFLYVYSLTLPRRQRWAEIFSSLICVVALLFLSGLSLSYIMQTYAFPRSVFFLAAVLQLVFLASWRRALWTWILRRHGPLALLIVGPWDEASKRREQLEKHRPLLFQVRGIVTDTVPPDRREDSSISLATYDELPVVLERLQPEGVLFCSSVPLEERSRLMAKAVAQGTSVFLIPRLEDLLLAGASMEPLNGIPAFRILGLQEMAVGGWKRLLDFALALVLAVPALPIILLAALAVKLDSPGAPAFYVQERVGRGGRVFRLIKLRTMVPEAEKDTGPVLATRDDPRLTRVGRFLRATRIDELPQLWNVLKGDMSFVGPRPERPFFVSQLEREIPGYYLRHCLPPGITGLAQVEGEYSTPPEDKLRYDLLYARSASLLTDLRIILRTLSVMMLRDKAS
ncbi:exopolysaccharide biosynthesis polyprenyl glycosylphosphotransferase [Ammonifex degensii KC4]|uniref:Exopolysaccharide biosynthesis polyprenyl glycosylphosphotransferase n=1 Tax=Ammonifex degensii (strain DSM 10501 / KC4) TaxID=429009 RepID=C9RBP0_AMMDK|nr:sugar transferase [Ammonifex degensii]ACX51667.1 exopolysaccharide biosynthesis polyprenyl glycosylphosphotransferase [Ammonifex degensii KC4]